MQAQIHNPGTIGHVDYTRRTELYCAIQIALGTVKQPEPIDTTFFKKIRGKYEKKKRTNNCRKT